MENLSVHKFCSACEARLKRQVMGSNIFYYCRSCGRVSSEACLSGGANMLHATTSLDCRVSSKNNLKPSEDTQKAMVGT
ncbi:MAG TPA: hypothetical protein HA306_07980 [Methanosarcina sp.]|nr:hypothetical protein [Methanosarcina sp.]